MRATVLEPLAGEFSVVWDGFFSTCESPRKGSFSLILMWMMLICQHLAAMLHSLFGQHKKKKRKKTDPEMCFFKCWSVLGVFPWTITPSNQLTDGLQEMRFDWTVLLVIVISCYLKGNSVISVLEGQRPASLCKFRWLTPNVRGCFTVVLLLLHC